MYALLPIENTCSYQLHFNYRLDDIQREIEKRTSYLGKFRRTEQASHLQDLIAMTRDEQNLLIPFAQSAMADVWDQLRKGVLHLSGLDYEWEDKVDVRDITLNPAVRVGAEELVSNHTDNTITIKDSFSILEKIDTYIYGVELDVELKVGTMFYVKDGMDSQVVNERTVKTRIPYTNTYYADGTWNIIPYTIEIKLDGASDFTSNEVITNATIVSVSASSYNKREESIDLGEYIKVNDKVYCVVKHTNVNTIDMNKDVVEVTTLDISDGIHYRMNIPSRINTNLITPLDTAILNALVNKIVHSWLLLSYPTEAEVYAALYASAAAQVYQRCNIFNVTHNKVPRIF